MIVVNTDAVPGYRVVRVLGMAQGNTVRAKHIGRDIAAGLKNIVGGELKGYTELLTEARREAVERMLAQARQLGANAVVNVRFSTSSIASGAAELYAYGTAMVVEPDESLKAAQASADLAQAAAECRRAQEVIQGLTKPGAGQATPSPQ